LLCADGCHATTNPGVTSGDGARQGGIQSLKTTHIDNYPSVTPIREATERRNRQLSATVQ
jgi:hypothetical protein